MMSKNMGETQNNAVNLNDEQQPPNLGKRCSQRRRKILLGTKVSPLVTTSQARVNRIKTNLQMWLSSVIPLPKISLVRNCQETKILMLFFFWGHHWWHGWFCKTGYQAETEENYPTCRHQHFEDGSTKENKKQSGWFTWWYQSGASIHWRRDFVDHLQVWWSIS